MTINDVKMQQPVGKTPKPNKGKPYKGMAMEGPIAKWYTKIRNNDPQHGQICGEISAIVPSGGRILEVAPGPGYLAIELAKLDKYDVVGLDISHSFVEIAAANAKAAGVAIDFRQGNASALPFAANMFDFVVCVAAFKNFTEPGAAMREMYRVLMPGGTALINDLRGDASQADINALVDGMDLNAVNRFMTKWTFKSFLLKNAYTAAQIEQLVGQTEFGHARIEQDLVSMKIWLEKNPAP
jgi:ubiquinone/menaquinone biosynthesis C-methylase UbiE